jgi:hypothetical protein
MTDRHAMSIRIGLDDYQRLTAYATTHQISMNKAIQKLIHDNIGPATRRCEYATRVDSPDTCTAPITHLIVYTGQSGRNLSEDTVCPHHEHEALNRPARKGSRVTAQLRDLPE